LFDVSQFFAAFDLNSTLVAVIASQSTGWAANRLERPPRGGLFRLVASYFRNPGVKSRRVPLTDTLMLDQTIPGTDLMWFADTGLNLQVPADTNPRRLPTLRHRPRRLWSDRLAQEAVSEGSRVIESSRTEKRKGRREATLS
jgi:hypothetical protein